MPDEPPKRGPTLRDLRRLDQLKVVERQTAAILKLGDTLLYVENVGLMDLDLDEVRDAVRRVAVEKSWRGNIAITIPGTKNQFEIACLAPARFVNDPKFFYMEPGCPIPEWAYRKAPPVSRATAPCQGSSVQGFTSPPKKIVEDVDFANLVRDCSILKFDVIQFFHRWFMLPEISLSGNNGFLSVTSSGTDWKAFYDLLRTQLGFLGFTFDEKLSEVEIPNERINKDLFRIAIFVAKKRNISFPYGPSQAKVSCKIIKFPSRSICALHLYLK